MLSSRYRTVDPILEEGSICSDDDDDVDGDSDDFEQQEARFVAEEEESCNGFGSRPNCEGEESKSDAYGDVFAILEQAAQACDQDLANQYQLTSPPGNMGGNNNTYSLSSLRMPASSMTGEPSDDIVLPTLAKKKSSLDDEDPVAPASSSGMEKWSKYNFSNNPRNIERGGNNINSQLSSSYGQINTTSTEKPKQLLGEKRSGGLFGSGSNIIGSNTIGIGSKWSKYNSNPSDDLTLPVNSSSSPLPKQQQTAYNSGDDHNNTIERSSSFGHVEKVNSPPLPTMATSSISVDEKVMAPSEDAYEQLQLSPCESCGRTFNAKALERHKKVCEKVSTKKRQVFDLSKKRTDGQDIVPSSLNSSRVVTPKKTKIVKPEDEFQECPSCSRKFGPKAYDRHVTWCMEKARRISNSPKKDLEALAKLQTRVTYRPNTPTRKVSSGSGGSPSRKASNTSVESITSPTPGTTPFQRSHSRNSNNGGGGARRSFSGTKSLGRSSGISFLKNANHTVETQDTHFIRAATGRGSIKRGPAPTRASVLRQQKTDEMESRSQTPNLPRKVASPAMTPTMRRRAPSPGGGGYGSYGGSTSSLRAPSPGGGYGGLSDYMFQSLVRPSVVRPSRSSYGMRREPEGIENNDSGQTSRSSSRLGLKGHYDHSQEYDPYQSAALQMQELLFGSSKSSNNTTSSGNNNSNTENLKPSSNSAFQKYIPASNIPSTADINNKLSSSSSRTSPRRLSWETTNNQNKSRDNNNTSSSNTSSSSSIFPMNKPGGFGERMASKVAKFCHECGNAFALPDIRFCCECGVKRLNC